MSAHEALSPTPEERRQDVMMDAGGFNGYTATGGAAVGYEQDSITVAIPREKPRHTSRRGGRAYPEGEYDPHWNPDYVPLSDEERAAQDEVKQSLGYRQAHQVAALAEDRELIRKANGNQSLLLALQRARYERRNQQQ